jgi:acetyl-CoA synthetase
MYWIGLQPGDVHMNVSSPGWAKHAWSCVFAPWIAGATICLFNYERFDARALLDIVRDTKVTTFCAPPTVWRMLVQQDLTSWQMSLRELVSAGEPLNPEVIEQVRQAWGLTIRDGFGQTETTLQIGNSPGQPTRLGSMGRPMPGFRIALVDPLSEAIADEGEICVECEPERPVGLMVGYQRDHERNADAFAGHRYHTGDVATRDQDGFITFVGRTDDVFKASDSPRTSCATLGRNSLRTSGFAGCNSRTCPRRSAARSGGSNCGIRKRNTPAFGRRGSTARRISRADVVDDAAR